MGKSKPVAKQPLITGASGLVGQALLERIEANGAQALALSRNPSEVPTNQRHGATFLAWNGKDFPEEALCRANAIIHLAGEPIFAGPLTRERRRRIRTSRVESTRMLVSQLGQLPPEKKPRCLICASAVGIYADRGDEILTETSAPGTGFLAQICQEWESAAREAEQAGVRVCSIRIGLVLSGKGGALPRMILPFRFGLGGPFGRGHNWVPWIQIDDLTRLILWLCERDDLHGAFNAVAPECVRNREFVRLLGKALRRPSCIPVPSTLIRLALGDLAKELIDSRHVRPARALDEGFIFECAELRTAFARELENR